MEEAIALMPRVPSYSPVIKNLTYIYEENLSRETEFGGSDFGGYPTLAQRDDSYDIRESMNMHCGYVFRFVWYPVINFCFLYAVVDIYYLAFGYLYAYKFHCCFYA